MITPPPSTVSLGTSRYSMFHNRAVSTITNGAENGFREALKELAQEGRNNREANNVLTQEMTPKPRN